MYIYTSFLTYREEQLRAQGLDPSQFRESSSFDERCLRLDLGCGIPRETTATHGQSTEDSRTAVAGMPQTSHMDTVGVRGGRRTAVELSGVGVGDVGDKDKDKDKDTPSSTPLPPSLGVPIVTHSKGSKEGTCSLCTCIFTVPCHDMLYTLSY